MYNLLAAGYPLLLNKHKQQGAIAIEFAAIFVLFFVMVYGIISFGIPTAVRMGFQHYSAEAARMAIRADKNSENFATQLSTLISTTITESWLPGEWLSGCNAPALSTNPDDETGADNPWQSLSTPYGFYRELSANASSYQLYVCIQTTHPIVPQINLMGIEFPPLPKEGDKTVIRGYTITTL